MTKTPKELTEDWKMGSLPSGWYYIKIEGFKDVDIDLYDKEGNSWLCNSDKDLNPLNVISPIPIYDEYKAIQEKDKMWSELAENLLCLEEEKWENLVENGTKEQQLDFLRHKEKYSLLAILDKYDQLKKELESARWCQTIQNEEIEKLCGLLKECLPIVSAEVMTWQIRGGEESRKKGKELLTKINEVLR